MLFAMNLESLLAHRARVGASASTKEGIGLAGRQAESDKAAAATQAMCRVTAGKRSSSMKRMSPRLQRRTVGFLCADADFADTGLQATELRPAEKPFLDELAQEKSLFSSCTSRHPRVCGCSAQGSSFFDEIGTLLGTSTALASHVRPSALCWVGKVHRVGSGAASLVPSRPCRGWLPGPTSPSEELLELEAVVGATRPEACVWRLWIPGPAALWRWASTAAARFFPAWACL